MNIFVPQNSVFPAPSFALPTQASRNSRLPRSFNPALVSGVADAHHNTSPRPYGYFTTSVRVAVPVQRISRRIRCQRARGASTISGAARVIAEGDSADAFFHCFRPKHFDLAPIHSLEETFRPTRRSRSRARPRRETLSDVPFLRASAPRSGSARINVFPFAPRKLIERTLPSLHLVSRARQHKIRRFGPTRSARISARNPRLVPARPR